MLSPQFAKSLTHTPTLHIHLCKVTYMTHTCKYTHNCEPEHMCLTVSAFVLLHTCFMYMYVTLDKVQTCWVYPWEIPESHVWWLTDWLAVQKHRFEAFSYMKESMFKNQKLSATGKKLFLLKGVSYLFPLFVASSHSSAIFIETQKCSFLLSGHSAVYPLWRFSGEERCSKGWQVVEVVRQNELFPFALLGLAMGPQWFCQGYRRNWAWSLNKENTNKKSG